MALKDTWVDKVDDTSTEEGDIVLAEDINDIAHAVIENEERIDAEADKPGMKMEGKEVEALKNTVVTAGEGAEIFNDYRARSWLGALAMKGNIASGKYARAEGTCTTAVGDSSYAGGKNTKAIGNQSRADGYKTTASGVCSCAQGGETEASGNYSNATGYQTFAVGTYSHTEGSATSAEGNYAHAEGGWTSAKGKYSHAGGIDTVANNYQTVIGKYNAEYEGPATETSASGALFIVGNGTDDDDRSNAFRVDTDGSVYGVGAYNTTGADYAEYFEWQDGNPKNEDRRGLFVTLDGEKIRPANAEDDYILGVISAAPSVIGDGQEDYWRGKYLTDVFGGLKTEVVTVEEHTDGRTGETVPEHEETRYILNPAYNSEEEYISREKRPEWATVGLMGKLVVTDDGTCEVNGYCAAGEGGIATKAESGYRVMKRIDDTHIKILFRG